jgi:Uma2 family endonuclease
MILEISSTSEVVEMTVATEASPFGIQQRMTLEAYLERDHGSDCRYELEDGIVIYMSSEKLLNPCVAMMLVFTFYDLGVARSLLAIGHQIVVRSTYATCREPDLVVHTHESDAAMMSGEKVLGLDSPPPLLVVEVASSTLTDSASRKRDYISKPREYADRGISEMWIVDPDRAWVQVGRLFEGQYAFSTFVGDEVIVSPTFPGLALTAAIVLAAGR